MKDSFSFVLMLFVAFVVLSAPLALRYAEGTSLVIGEESYYHARIAGQMISGSLSPADTLVYNERPLYFGPYHVLLALFGKYIGIDLASVAIPVFLSLGKFGVVGSRRVIMSLLLISSPSFIGTFIQSNPHALAVPLYLVGLYLLASSRSISLSPKVLLGFFVLVATILFGVFNFVLLIILLLGYYTVERRKMMVFFLVLAFLFVVSLVYYLLFSIPGSLVSVLVSDLGGSGFGVFSLVLLAAGIILCWKDRYSFFLPFALLLSLLSMLLLFRMPVVAYLGFIVAVFVGEGLYRLLNMDWNLPLIKRLTVLLVLCGLLFSYVSFSSRMYNLGPDPEIIESMEALKAMEPGLVLSHYSNGFWIEYFAEKPVFLDGFSVLDSERRLEDSKAIFISRDLDETRRLLSKYNVRYIFIDESMVEGEVWSRKDDGLLFLLRNREVFENVFDGKKAEIFEYKPPQLPKNI